LKLVFTTIAAKVFLTLVPIVIKFTTVNIWTIGIFRLVIACSFFYFFAKKGFLEVYRKIWLLGPLFFIHWITYFMAVKVSNPSTAVIGLSTYGFILLVYSRIFFNKPIEKKYFFGVLIALIGTYVAIGDFNFANQQFLGLLWGLASALAYGALPIIHQKNQHIQSKHKAYSQFLGAFVLFILFGSHKFQLPMDAVNMTSLVYLAIGGTIIGHTLWVKVTTELPTTVTSCIYYLAIPLSMLLEYLILNIPMTLSKLIGGGLIVGGNIFVLVVSKTRKQKTIPITES